MGTIYKNGVKFSGSGGSIVEVGVLPEIGEEQQKLNCLKINGDSYVLNGDYIVSSEEEFIHLYNNVLKDARDYTITTILFANDITLHASVVAENQLSTYYTTNAMNKKRYHFDLLGYTLRIDLDLDSNNAKSIGADTFTWKNGNIQINKNKKYNVGIIGTGENLNISVNQPDTATGNSLTILPKTLNNCVVDFSINNRDGEITNSGTWNNSTITAYIRGVKTAETTPLFWNQFNNCSIEITFEATDKNITCFTQNTKNCKIKVTQTSGPDNVAGGIITVKRGGTSENDTIYIYSWDTNSISCGFIGIKSASNIFRTSIYIDTYDQGGTGFDTCNKLTECTFGGQYGGQLGGSRYYGFKECASLLSCVSTIYSRIGGNAYVSCTRLIGCRGGVDSNVAPSEDNLFNSDEIAAFSNCYGLYLCYATSEAGGPPSSAKRYAYHMSYASLDSTNHAANTQAGGYNMLDFTNA